MSKSSDAPKVERVAVPLLPRIRSAYDGSRVRFPLLCDLAKDRTQQSFKDECDINVLMKRYERTGILPVGRDVPPQFGDVTSLDFTESMNQVAAVRGVFSQLDARTRARFENDPSQMLDFLADPANAAEAVKLGLISQSETVVDERGQSADNVRTSKGGVPHEQRGHSVRDQESDAGAQALGNADPVGKAPGTPQRGEGAGARGDGGAGGGGSPRARGA